MTEPAPDRVMDDLLKARGIVATLRAAAMSAEGVRGEDTAHACWAVEDLLAAAEGGVLGHMRSQASQGRAGDAH